MWKKLLSVVCVIFIYCLCVMVGKGVLMVRLVLLITMLIGCGFLRSVVIVVVDASVSVMSK